MKRIITVTWVSLTLLAGAVWICNYTLRAHTDISNNTVVRSVSSLYMLRSSWQLPFPLCRYMCVCSALLNLVTLSIDSRITVHKYVIIVFSDNTVNLLLLLSVCKYQFFISRRAYTFKILTPSKLTSLITIIIHSATALEQHWPPWQVSTTNFYHSLRVSTFSNH